MGSQWSFNYSCMLFVGISEYTQYKIFDQFNRKQHYYIVQLHGFVMAVILPIQWYRILHLHLLTKSIPEQPMFLTTGGQHYELTQLQKPDNFLYIIAVHP